jgi:TonB family protein
MPILQLPSNPSRIKDPRNPDRPDHKTGDPALGPQGTPSNDPTAGANTQAVKVRTGRYGELEEHEIIHLIDSLDEESARARFRESVYISTLFFFALAWFLFYGPRVLFHQPEYKDPIALMKEHDKELTYITPPKAPPVPPHPVLDNKTMKQLQQEARVTPPTPQPPPPPQQPAPQPQEAHNTPPPVPQPQLPLPSAPKPQPSIDAPLPAAPRPSFAQNTPSARDAVRNAMQPPLPGGPGVYGGSAPSPGGKTLGAGAQILSDTQGVDFTAYLRRIIADTKRNWDPLIPEEVQAPLLKKGIVGIRFSILPSGQIGSMTLETPSGDQALDKAAWYAITSEGQFPPLPKEFHGPQLELRFGFFYNLQPPQ